MVDKYPNPATVAIFRRNCIVVYTIQMKYILNVVYYRLSVLSVEENDGTALFLNLHF